MSIKKTIPLKMLVLIVSLLLFSSCKKKGYSNIGKSIDTIYKKKIDIESIDSLKLKRIIASFKNDLRTQNRNEYLNKKYLLDTLYGDCIFYELGLDSLYENGRLYLLKKEIWEKNIFKKHYRKEIAKKINSIVNLNNEIKVSLNNSGDEFESSIIFNFKIINDRIFLYSVHCTN